MLINFNKTIAVLACDTNMSGQHNIMMGGCRYQASKITITFTQPSNTPKNMRQYDMAEMFIFVKATGSVDMCNNQKCMFFLIIFRRVKSI